MKRCWRTTLAHPQHPVWNVAALAIILNVFAEHFDATEWKAIGSQAVVATVMWLLGKRSSLGGE